MSTISLRALRENEESTDSSAELVELALENSSAFVAPQQSGYWKKAAAATGAVLLLAGAGFGAAMLRGGAAPAGADGFQEKAMVHANPPRDACAEWYENCWGSGCCNVAGMTCFEVTPGKGQCLKNCTPSAERRCTQPKEIAEKIYEYADWYGPSMYCFAVVQQDHGSELIKHYDLQLLQGAYSKNAGIFACEVWGVFSDLDGEVAPGVPLQKMEDTDGDFKFAKRKNEGTWINTGVHTQAWKAIRAAGVYQSANWIVKTDCDSVFVPSRLAIWLKDYPVPKSGIYLENCRYVMYGYFGSLEIFSRQAFDTLVDNIDSCKQSLDWKVGIEGGKWGPMGEDLFAQACLDKNGVGRGEAFDIHMDGMCEANRPEDQKKNKKWHPSCSETNTAGYHPLREPEDWSACWEATIQAFGYDTIGSHPGDNKPSWMVERLSQLGEECMAVWSASDYSYGDDGITQEECEAKSLCYDDNNPVHRCWTSSTMLWECNANHANGDDCESYEGITEAECEAKGCCYDESADPWCFKKTAIGLAGGGDPGTGPSLFCFAVAITDDEKAVLDLQQNRGTGIFACNDWKRINGREKSLVGGGLTGNDVDSFFAAWKSVDGDNRWRKHEWTVKADPDTAWLPQRLRDWLGAQGDPGAGTFINTCVGVDSGFYGALEVISSGAMDILIRNLDTCYTDMQDMKEAIRENEFAQRCMASKGAGSWDAGELICDEDCGCDPRPCDTGRVAYHPFKAVDDHTNCIDAFLGQ